MNEGLVINPDIQSTQPQTAEMHRGRRIVLAATMAVGTAFGAIGIFESAPAEAATHQATAGDCSPIDFGHPASNSEHYESNAFLPKPGNIETQQQAKSYIDKLFSNGSLANETDKASLAAIMATVVEPANDGAATNPNYDYTAAFNEALARYKAPGGAKAAEQDCVTAIVTLQQVASYKSNWLMKGGNTVTQMRATRDDETNEITGYVPSQISTNKKLKGIVLALPNSNTKVVIDGKTYELDDFAEVLISTNKHGQWDGSLFLKGVTKGASTSDQQKNQGSKGEKNDQENGGGEGQKDTGKSGGNSQAGKNQGNTGTGGSAGPKGPNPEAGPGGVTNSPANGGEAPGTTPATTPETSPPATVPSTRPPETVPPITVPPTIPPTIPPTTQPPVKGPAPCDPNIAVCTTAMKTSEHVIAPSFI